MKAESQFEAQFAPPTPEKPYRTSSWPRVSLGVLAALLIFLAMIKLFDQAFIELNSRKLVLPRFDVTLMPYHDPRFSMRRHKLLQYSLPPQIIFTGDSRTMDSFDPEVIASVLGVKPDLFYNFATGSQGLSFAREVFIPHLLEIKRAPKYVVYGVTPDWLVNRPAIRYHVRWYKSSLAYRLAHPNTTASASDRVDLALTGFVARHLALYRYRTDLVKDGLVPDLKCWIFGDCHLNWPNYPPILFKEHAALDAAMTPYGFQPYNYSNFTGEYLGGKRFKEKDHVDQENLIGLIRDMRQVGIEPVLLVMPMHPSFDRVHEPVMSRNFREMDAIAADNGVDVLYPKGDYSDGTLFTDGHHHTIKGATYFSKDIAPMLRPYLRQ